MLTAFAGALVVLVGAAAGLSALRLLGAGPLATTPPEQVPFLGGGEPDTHAWNRFHVRYYPMTLVLVAFEMEMMVMYPWAVVYVREGLKALVEMGVFLAILSLGVVYAWREGALRWQ